jgi:hypothetical protein
MTPSELIKQHEEAIRLLERKVQEERLLRSCLENVAMYKHNGMLPLLEKESRMVGSLQARIKILSERYEELIKTFNN